MKKFIFRILAFLIDMIFINLIILGLNNISIINPNITNIQNETKVYLEVAKEYKDLSSKIDSILDDNNIDLSESIMLKSDYPYFNDVIKDIPVNRDLTNEEKNNIKDNIEKYYDKFYASYNYTTNRYNIIINIIGIIIAILYFGVFEWKMKGQTIGKKIFRLRTIDNDKPKKEIPLWKYLVKSIIVSETIFNLSIVIITLICHSGYDGTLNVMWFSKAYEIILDIEYAFNIFLTLLILFRKDERSLHDVLLNIRVALYDKKNKEITKRIFNEEVIDQDN